MSNQATITKQDVEEIVQRVVGDVVGEIVGDAMQLISRRFDHQDAAIAELQAVTAELQATTNRIENKLDATADRVDEHEVQLKALKQATA